VLVRVLINRIDLSPMSSSPGRSSPPPTKRTAPPAAAAALAAAPKGADIVEEARTTLTTDTETETEADTAAAAVLPETTTTTTTTPTKKKQKLDGGGGDDDDDKSSPASPPPPPSMSRRRVLEHVLVDVCELGEASSALLRDVRRGEIPSVDALCNLTDEQVSALVRNGSTSAAGTSEAAQEIEIRGVQLLRLWRARWYRVNTALPTSEDWLRLTRDGLNEVYLAETVKSPPEAAAAPAAAGAGAVTISPEDLAKAKQSAEAFVKSILEREPEDILESDGMRVMRGVVKLETGVKSDVVIRKLTRPFWQACIDTVDLLRPPSDNQQADATTNRQLRVCAVGTPGIGKTTCTAVLLRMLLKEKGGTIVYHVRAPKEAGLIYEFVPGSNDDGDPVTAKVYPEQAFYAGIPSLSEASTYYVVDPGDTDDTCNPRPLFRPKVIIVASPDSKHWGANYFYKDRDGALGVLKVFPVWELHELLHARPVLRRTMSVQQVTDRYNQVGGVPRHVFGSETTFNQALAKQTEKTDGMNCEQAERIAVTKMQGLTTLDASQPQSALIGFRARQEDGFSNYTIDVIAPRVGERLFRRLLRDMWDKLLLPGAGNPWILEAYTRYLLGTNRTLTFRRRRGVGRNHRLRGTVESVSLGGCGEIRSTWDVVAAAVERPMVVFHPVNPAQKLIDFIYRDSEDHFHAFQVTLADKHSADVNHILELERQVGDPGRLSLYYMVPEFRFATFVTHPVDPRNSRRGIPRATCNIYHVAIPDPNSMEEV
jgi:Retrotransposon hot spot protein